MGTFLGDTVEVGCLEEFRRFLHEAHEVVTMIVAQDEENVLPDYLFRNEELKKK
jgi:hypothetical protein